MTGSRRSERRSIPQFGQAQPPVPRGGFPDLAMVIQAARPCGALRAHAAAGDALHAILPAAGGARPPWPGLAPCRSAEYNSALPGRPCTGLSSRRCSMGPSLRLTLHGILGASSCTRRYGLRSWPQRGVQLRAPRKAVHGIVVALRCTASSHPALHDSVFRCTASSRRLTLHGILVASSCTRRYGLRSLPQRGVQLRAPRKAVHGIVATAVLHGTVCPCQRQA
jgi:hypothetical protein